MGRIPFETWGVEEEGGGGRRRKRREEEEEEEEGGRGRKGGGGGRTWNSAKLVAMQTQGQLIGGGNQA